MVTAAVFTVVAWRTGRRRLLWLPASVLIGVAVALAVRTWVDADALAGMRNTNPATGAIVEVTIDDAVSGFTHRNEYVYLPPACFTGDHCPRC